MRIYQGDLKPDLVLTLTTEVDGVRGPVNLTTATSIRLIGVRGGTVVIDRAVTGTALGVITMEWTAPDTATVGRIHIEAEVIWPGAKPQTFRPDSAVDVVPDLEPPVVP